VFRANCISVFLGCVTQKKWTLLPGHKSSLHPPPTTSKKHNNMIPATASTTTKMIDFFTKKRVMVIFLLVLVLVVGQLLLYSDTFFPTNNNYAIGSSLSPNTAEGSTNCNNNINNNDNNNNNGATTSTASAVISTVKRTSLNEIQGIVSSELNTFGKTSPISRLRYTMPNSHQSPASKTIYLMPVYSMESMNQLINAVPCIQHVLDNEKSMDEASNIIWIAYGVNLLHREMIEEMTTWKYFDYIHLPFNSQYDSLLKGDKYSSLEKDIVDHVTRQLNDMQMKQYTIANKDHMFDLDKTLKSFGIKGGKLCGNELNSGDDNKSIEPSLSNDTETADKTVIDHTKQKVGNELVERKKFAIVVPFPTSQISQVVQQLRRWRTYKPCTGVSKVYHDTTDLIFYFHRTENKEMEESVIKELTVDGTVNGDLRPEFHCLHPTIRFWYTNLVGGEDAYPASANFMFHRLLFDPRLYTQYQYFFYAEPDTFPVRNGWLNRLTNQAFLADSSWWISGSIYRGTVGSNDDPKRDGDLGEMYYNMHINGNALYNTIHSFREFVAKVRSKIPEEAYDTANPRYLFQANWKVTREEWSHFLFSDFVMNLWKSDWTIDSVVTRYPHTYFVHGKQQKQN